MEEIFVRKMMIRKHNVGFGIQDSGFGDILGYYAIIKMLF